MEYEIVTPDAIYVDALRGYPATHAAKGARTLCGKNPDGWQWQRENDLRLVSCKICRRIIDRSLSSRP